MEGLRTLFVGITAMIPQGLLRSVLLLLVMWWFGRMGC